jgi:hypothetical protein
MTRRGNTSGWFMLCTLLLPLVSVGTWTTAQASEYMLAQFGCGLAITAEGNIFSSDNGGSCAPTPSNWVLAGSLFGGGGPGAGGGVIGINSKGEVLTSGGDEYQLSIGSGCSSVGGSPRGNVFLDSGVAVGDDPLVAFGDTNAGYVYAVTGQGRVFARGIKGCAPTTWTYVGALPAGPTSAKSTTWGALKTHYR